MPVVYSSRVFIAYQPPDWGQPVRPKDPLGAYAAVQQFLKHCTDSHGTANWLSLIVQESGQHSPPDYDSRRVLADAAARFGPGERTEALRMFPDTGRVEYKHEWRLPSDALPDALNLIATLPRWRSKYISPVLFSVAFDFHLCDPRTGEVLPNQGPESRVGQWPEGSSIMLHLSSVPVAPFELRFPFESPSVAFLSYLGALVPYLPIQVAWTRFRLMIPNRSGSDYIARKIDPDMLHQLATGSPA